MFKIIFWPFKKFLGWLASGLPSNKKEEEVAIKLDHCGMHSRYKKSCPACKAIVQ